jgi:pentatricopeptide repeat protein
LFDDGKIEEATRLYFTRPDVYGASFLISQQKDVDNAFKIFNVLSKNQHNLVLIRSLLNTCKKLRRYKEMSVVWDHMAESGIEPDVVCSCLFVEASVSTNDSDLALKLITHLEHANKVPVREL